MSMNQGFREILLYQRGNTKGAPEHCKSKPGRLYGMISVHTKHCGMDNASYPVLYKQQEIRRSIQHLAHPSAPFAPGLAVIISPLSLALACILIRAIPFTLPASLLAPPCVLFTFILAQAARPVSAFTPAHRCSTRSSGDRPPPVACTEPTLGFGSGRSGVPVLFFSIIGVLFHLALGLAGPFRPVRYSSSFFSTSCLQLASLVPILGCASIC